MDIRIDQDELKDIRELDWPKVRAAWAERERDSGIEHLFAARGVRDWEGFRRQAVRKYGLGTFKLPTLNWRLVEFQDPAKSAGKLLCGPFEGWMVKYGGTERRSIPMGDIVAADQFQPEVRDKIMGILEGEAVVLTVIALRNSMEQTIMLLDGHHSTSAVIKALSETKTVPRLQLHMGDIHPDHVDQFRKMVAGSVEVIPGDEIECDDSSLF